MSKTTIFLLILLFSVIGILLYIMYVPKNNAIIASISEPIRAVVTPIHTTLSISPSTQFIQPGQTVTLAVLIHNPNPHPSVVQLEISYDPAIFTIDSLMPGTFFESPTVALEKVDPLTGRISYALRCPEVSNNVPDCTNSKESTVALITITSSAYAYNRKTELLFLPKTVVRTGNGRDILEKTSALEITIGKVAYPISSSSAVGSPGANFIRTLQKH